MILTKNDSATLQHSRSKIEMKKILCLLVLCCSSCSTTNKAPVLLKNHTYYYPDEYPYLCSFRIEDDGSVAFNYFITSNALEFIQVECVGRRTFMGQRVVSGKDLKIHVVDYDGHTLKTNTATHTNEAEKLSKQASQTIGSEALPQSGR